MLIFSVMKNFLSCPQEILGRALHPEMRETKTKFKCSQASGGNPQGCRNEQVDEDLPYLSVEVRNFTESPVTYNGGDSR